MIYTCGLTFHEKEIIKPGDILTCHTQRIDKEIIGIPLRACIGIQSFYDKIEMKHTGVTFYAPPKNRPSDEPHENLKFVLACTDGMVRVVNGELILINDKTIYIYSNLNISKSSGTVKKGQIIGTVKFIEGGFGYGVNLRAYKNGETISINKLIANIPNIE